MLKDARHRKALLDLPSRLMDIADRTNGERGAYVAQYAVAIELLLQTAMRISNLAKLRFGSQIIQTGIGKTSKIFVLIDAADVKNDEPIRFQLPHEAAKMLRHLSREVPAAPALFQCNRALSRQERPDQRSRIARNAAEHGDQGAHGPRHQSAPVPSHRGLSIYSSVSSGDMATMQRVLGDRQLAVVMKHYAFLDRSRLVPRTRRRSQPNGAAWEARDQSSPGAVR